MKWFQLSCLLLWLLEANAAPFPAHLVVGNRRPVHWQEFPVALKPVRGASFKPILAGTDHGLYNEGFFEGDILRAGKHTPFPDAKNAVTDGKLLWPYGTVVYKVDDDVGCPESPQCEILMSAIDHYHENSCIRFKEWTGEENYVSIFFNSGSSGACWSPVGRVGDGEQRLSLGQRCWYKGIVIHELGHAIGFWHEMNRPDRDDWIYVYWQNIIPGFSSAFRKHDQRTVATLREQFDYRSIMMYDEYAFSKDGSSPTLQAVTGEEIGPIWRKRGLSASDKRRLQKLYRCDATKPKPGFPYDINCDFNYHTCGFKNGGSAAWNWRTVNQSDGYVYSSFENAGSTPGHFMSVNLPPQSEDGEKTNGPLGCVRFYYLIQSDAEAQLKLEQAYLNKVTQLNHDETSTFSLWENDTATNEWIYVEVPLYVTRPFRLIFTSQFNESSTHGTVALDDVEVLYRPCNPEAVDSTPPSTVHAPRPTTATPTTTAPPTSTTTEPSTTTAASTSPEPTEGSTTSSSADLPPTSQRPSSSTTGAPTKPDQQQQQQYQQQQQQHQQQQHQQQQHQQHQQQQQQQSSTSSTSSATETPDLSHYSTTFPTFQTVATVTSSSNDATTAFVFPIKLNETYTSFTPTTQKMPNLPNPTNKIPLPNPNKMTTTTASPPSSTTYDYDVDESLAGQQ